ncbi:MAG: class I SAM-dependent methyltransferase [Marmoricola sp.]
MTSDSAIRPIDRAWQRLYPEHAAGGYGRGDATVQFYGRVDALLRPDHVVVDFGAGRGQPFDGPVTYGQRLQTLRGRVAKVIGVDIDPVVKQNPSLDEALVWTPGLPIDLPDGSVDVIVSDYTFEHIDDPEAVAAEFERILKPGGWVCARTPNRRGFIAVGARIVPNAAHGRWLRRLQPGRQVRDVFPTRYRLNTLGQVRGVFARPTWEVHGFATGEPAYVGESPVLTYLLFGMLRVLPMRLQPMYLFFIRKTA